MQAKFKNCRYFRFPYSRAVAGANTRKGERGVNKFQGVKTKYKGCSKSFASPFCTRIVVTWQRCARAHIFWEGIVNAYTKFGEKWFIILCCVNEKPW